MFQSIQCIAREPSLLQASSNSLDQRYYIYRYVRGELDTNRTRKCSNVLEGDAAQVQHDVAAEETTTRESTGDKYSIYCPSDN